MRFDAVKYVVKCPKGSPKFSGLATRRTPKLYLVGQDHWPIYVGMTRQSMNTRLRMGFTATGESGYHGYAWRRTCTAAWLDIWCLADDAVPPTVRDAETVEAEIVFRIREKGQWPEHQTEIHFYPSNDEHRRIADHIMGHYRKA
ncbi:MAG TPA: hypothetical protein PKE29_13110 [Phycisphaerales bacterium]|nr:hypothetical protein [Phycisphaerales bacterium]